MMLWDGLFASFSPTSDLVLWLCVAMLIRIRTKREIHPPFRSSHSPQVSVIPSDYSTQLTYLLRYPACPPPEAGAPHHIVLLIRHATALEISPHPATGAALMIENRNFLNIPLEVSDPPIPRRRPRQQEKAHLITPSESSAPGTSGSQMFSPQLSFPELFARGLLDRGESLGINKTVMNAVSELKVRVTSTHRQYSILNDSQRNLPDLASTLVRPPFATSPFSAYPLLDDKSPEERYVRNHRSDLESARDLAELRQQNRHLGEAAGWVLDVLVQEGSSGTYQAQRKQALESLSYIRDVLRGQVEEVDERRLWGEVEFKKRWEAREKSPPPAGEPSTTGRDTRSGGGNSTSARSTRSGSGLPSSAPRESRRFTPSPPISSSANGQRSYTTATPQPPKSMPSSAGLGGRSQPPGGTSQASARSDVFQRGPLRVSANNPFQRVLSDGSKVAQARGTTSEQIPTLRSEVQHDPLGVYSS